MGGIPVLTLPAGATLADVCLVYERIETVDFIEL